MNLTLQNEPFKKSLGQNIVSNLTQYTETNNHSLSVLKDLTKQQFMETVDLQENLSSTITPKYSGYSGINFWNCSGKLAKIWYNDENDSRAWIRHGEIGSQSVCPSGPPQLTLSFINGHTYDVVVSMSGIPGCSGDWPDDQECGKDFLYNQYGDSSQTKRPHYIYR